MNEELTLDGFGLGAALGIELEKDFGAELYRRKNHNV